MTLVGCAATPHPPIIVPEVGRERTADVASTLEAMRTLGEHVRDLDPDVIVVMSPHARIDPSRMGVSTASVCTGSLAYFGAPHVRFSLPGRPQLAEAIIGAAAERGVNSGPLSDRGGRLELDHGCMVPLAFLVPPLAQPPALVVLAFSYLDPSLHWRFGEAVGRALDAADERVFYVASGDLSHRLTLDAPAGYVPRAADFDRAVVELFEAGDGKGFLDISPALLHDAGECGYRSLVTLFGLLEGRAHTTHLLSYEGPFGVGYMVGSVELTAAAG